MQKEKAVKPRSLKRNLEKLTKDVLLEIISTKIGEDIVPPFLLKQDLINYVMDYLQDPLNLEEILLYAPDASYNLTKLLMAKDNLKANHILEGFWYLHNNLFVNKPQLTGDEKLKSFYIFDEIKQALQTVNWEKVEKMHPQIRNFTSYIDACVNFYGLLETKDLMHIYFKQNTDLRSQELLELIMISYEQYSDSFRIINDMIVNTGLLVDGTEELQLLLNLTKGKPLYIPEKEELLKFQNVLYYQVTPQMLKLKEQLMEQFGFDEEKAEDIVYDASNNCDLDGKPGDLFNEIFEHYSIEFENMEQAKLILDSLMVVNNTTRMWSNRGFTPEEILSFGKASRKVHPLFSSKVGPNDLCPCGSGKKYKKCCGKLG